MSIGNTGFHPSYVEDRIYDLMNKPENACGWETYTANLMTDVTDMLETEFPGVQWESFTSEWQNMEGATVSFAWVEDGHLHLIGWDYKF